jgi:hypothetical protein
VETTGIECFHGVARIPHFLGISHSERPLNEENKSNEKLDEVLTKLLIDGRQNTIVVLLFC